MNNVMIIILMFVCQIIGFDTRVMMSTMTVTASFMDSVTTA
jgi:hypothetical protein